MRLRIRSICLIILLVVSVNSTMTSIVDTHDNPSSEDSTLEKIDSGLNNPSDKISDRLMNYMNSGTIPENFTGKTMVFSKSKNLGFDTLIPPVKLGSQYFHIIDNVSPTKIRTLYLDPTVTSIIDDYPVDYTASPETSKFGDQPSADSFQADDILGTSKVYQEFGYTGDGVKIGVIDSGVDFGISDLTDSAVLADSGYLASFDITGTGIGITSLTLNTTESQGDNYLPLDGETLKVFMGDRGEIQTTDQLGIQLDDVKITNLPEPSISEEYKVGIAYQGSLVQNLISQYFLFILADTQTSGVYDRIYVDMETSLSISLVQAGVILPSGRTFIDLNEFDITNDQPFGPNNPIPAKDITGDGVNDISMGGLAKVIDLAGVTGKDLVEGIDPDGNAIGMMFDPVGHGALVASSAAGDGNTSFPIYDDKTTSVVENGTGYTLPGSAPDAKIIAHKAFSVSDFITGWLWTGGLELISNSSGQLEWVINENQVVDVSSNSWGIGNVASSDTMKGFDSISLLLDFLATEDSLFTGYPGMVFVVSGGNGAPGWGTTATPGMASMAITIGASTYYHYRNGSSGRNDVAWFSARGPSSYGTIKPDVITPGHTGFVNVQVIQGNGNGTYAYGTFGGTSEAAPRASGVIALMIEAMRDHGMDPSLGNLRLVLKSTASDLGFHPAQQGAGLVNAYDAINTIVNNGMIFSSTYSSKIAGERLNGVFSDEYNENHPLFSNPLPDPVSVVSPDQLANGITIDLTYLNGTSIPVSEYSTTISRNQLAHNNSVSIETTQSQNIKSLADIMPDSLQGYNFMELSMTMNQNTWQAFLDNGLGTPNITLFDPESGDIVADILSFNTHSQLLFTGNPAEDFIGTPSIQFTDPGFQGGIPNWQGMVYEINARLFTQQNWVNAVVTENTGNISVSVPDVISEFQVSTIEIDLGSTIKVLPLVISPTHQAEFGENVKPVGSDLDIVQPFAQNQVANTYDWGYRPESGDFNHYRISVPDNATFLATFARWNLPGLSPNMYLFNSTGDLITNSEVEYIGGGFYQSETSQPFQQNLLIPVEDDFYYLMIHTTNLPYSAGPFDLDVSFRYLDLETLPVPNPIYSQDINNPLSGNLLIDASEYSIPQFPEFFVQSINGQVYQGSNATMSGKIEQADLNNGPNSNYIPEQYDDVVKLNLTKGDKVDLELEWEHDVDADIFVFKEGSTVFKENDLLKGTGSSPGTGFEQVKFAAEETGEYLVYIDYIGGLLPGELFNYTLSYEARTGPTITSNTDVLEIDTSLFPDDEYGVLITFLTNFDYSFENRINITTENSNDFQFSVDTPSEGAELSGQVDVSWTSSVPVSVNIYLIIDGTPILVVSDVDSTSTSFNSREYPNGDAILRVTATDQIYIHTVDLSVTLSNSDVSTLPEIETSDPRNLSFAVLMLIGIFGIPLIRRMRNKTNYLEN